MTTLDEARQRAADLRGTRCSTLSPHRTASIILDLIAMVEARDAALDRYRYALAFAGAEAWDGSSDWRQRVAWASSSDEGRDLTDDQVARIGKLYPVGSPNAARDFANDRASRRAGAEEMRGNALDAIRNVKRIIGAHDGSSISSALEHAAADVRAISVGENR